MSLGGCGSEILSQFFKIVSELNGGTGEFLHWRRIDGLLRLGQAGETNLKQPPNNPAVTGRLTHSSMKLDTLIKAIIFPFQSLDIEIESADSSNKMNIHPNINIHQTLERGEHFLQWTVSCL